MSKSNPSMQQSPLTVQYDLNGQQFLQAYFYPALVPQGISNFPAPEAADQWTH